MFIFISRSSLLGKFCYLPNCYTRPIVSVQIDLCLFLSWFSYFSFFVSWVYNICSLMFSGVEHAEVLITFQRVSVFIALTSNALFYIFCSHRLQVCLLYSVANFRSTLLQYYSSTLSVVARPRFYSQNHSATVSPLLILSIIVLPTTSSNILTLIVSP